VQSTTASHNNDNSIVAIWRISFESLKRRRRRASQRSAEEYIYEGDVGGAVEWRQIKLYTSLFVLMLMTVLLLLEISNKLL